jgi:hypothetical protein
MFSLHLLTNQHVELTAGVISFLSISVVKHAFSSISMLLHHSFAAHLHLPASFAFIVRQSHTSVAW